MCSIVHMLSVVLETRVRHMQPAAPVTASLPHNTDPAAAADHQHTATVDHGRTALDRIADTCPVEGLRMLV